MNAAEIVGLIAQIITLVALVVTILQLIGSRTSRHREFENLYVQRYWNLMDSFEGDPWKAFSATELTAKDRRRLSAYLWLCEDELNLRRNGFIMTKTWGIWAAGINIQGRVNACQDILQRLPQSELEGLRNFLETAEHDIRGADPLRMSSFRKWWTGLGNAPWREPRRRTGPPSHP